MGFLWHVPNCGLIHSLLQESCSWEKKCELWWLCRDSELPKKEDWKYKSIRKKNKLLYILSSCFKLEFLRFFHIFISVYTHQYSFNHFLTYLSTTCDNDIRAHSRSATCDITRNFMFFLFPYSQIIVVVYFYLVHDVFAFANGKIFWAWNRKVLKDSW